MVLEQSKSIASIESSEVKSVPLEPKTRLRKFTHAVILAVFLATGLTACGLDWRDDEVQVGILISPKGAVAPEGLDEITIESTQNEVIQILGSRYEHFPSQWAGGKDLGPLSDGFLYKEGGVTKYIEVIYSGSTIGTVYYGYDEFKGIE